MEEDKGMSVVQDFLVQNDGSLRLSVRQPAVDNQSISLRYDSRSKKKQLWVEGPLEAAFRKRRERYSAIGKQFYRH